MGFSLPEIPTERSETGERGEQRTLAERMDTSIFGVVDAAFLCTPSLALPACFMLMVVPPPSLSVLTFPPS